MAITTNQELTTEELDPPDYSSGTSGFEEAMLQRILKDINEAQSFTQTWHRSCVDSYRQYFIASQYEDIKKVNKFPVSYYQQKIDETAAYAMDKLFYRDRPCTLVGREETDKQDATSKQEMLNWQDYKDMIRSKMEMFWRDTCQYRIAVARVDYCNETRKTTIGVEEPAVDELGMPVLDPATGQPILESKTAVVEETVYKGPRVRRIDPVDFFFGGEAQEMSDEHPKMVRSRHTIQWFKEQRDGEGAPLFFNVDEIAAAKEQKRAGFEETESDHNKRMAHDFNPEQSKMGGVIEYFEWWGKVSKRKL